MSQARLRKVCGKYNLSFPHHAGQSGQPLNVNWISKLPTCPGYVTRIVMRFDLSHTAPTTPGQQVLYVWHCRILEHEDNERMRPYKIIVEPLRYLAFSSLREIVISTEAVRVFARRSEVNPAFAFAVACVWFSSEIY